MSEFLFKLAPVMMVVVAIILGLGLWNMARGGDNERTQKLMRYRVLAQFAAVIVMLAALYYSGR